MVFGALDALRTGIALFDTEDRLIYCNEHFRYVYRSFENVEQLVGMTYGEILEMIVEGGEIAGEEVIKEPESWIERRMARRFEMPPRPTIERLTDGRWIEVKDRPVKGLGLISLWQDVTGLKQSDLRLRDFLHGAADGLALWNQQDQLYLGNELFFDLFPEQARPELGSRFHDCATVLAKSAMEGDDVAVGYMLENWSQQHTRPVGSYVFQLPDGRWMMSRERRIRDGGTATVFTDITDLKNREQELILRGATLEETINELEMVQHKLEQQAVDAVGMAEALSLANDEVEHANRAKANFLRNISHELRTPLHTIIGFAELLQKPPAGEQGWDGHAEYARDILNSGHHLLRLVNRLLDLSRIDAGRYELSFSFDDLHLIVRDTLRLVRGSAQEADVVLIDETDDDLPAVMLDEQAIRQVMINLLSNAIKFTPAGGTVRVRSRRLDDGVEVSIKDNGVGIPAEVLPRLMRPFERYESNPYGKREGTGLGLAISRGLAELHGGSLSIESELGQGTRATLSLPLSQADDDSVSETPSRAAS